jgi:hypothetical protein
MRGTLGEPSLIVLPTAFAANKCLIFGAGRVAAAEQHNFRYHTTAGCAPSGLHPRNNGAGSTRGPLLRPLKAWTYCTL